MKLIKLLKGLGIALKIKSQREQFSWNNSFLHNIQEIGTKNGSIELYSKLKTWSLKFSFIP